MKSTLVEVRVTERDNGAQQVDLSKNTTDTDTVGDLDTQDTQKLLPELSQNRMVVYQDQLKSQNTPSADQIWCLDYQDRSEREHEEVTKCDKVSTASKSTPLINIYSNDLRTVAALHC